jgi:hypothetical protein
MPIIEFYCTRAVLRFIKEMRDERKASRPPFPDKKTSKLNRFVRFLVHFISVLIIAHLSVFIVIMYENLLPFPLILIFYFILALAHNYIFQIQNLALRMFVLVLYATCITAIPF